MRYYHISLNQTDVSTKSAPYSPPKEEPAAVYLLSLWIITAKHYTIVLKRMDSAAMMG